MHLRILLYCSVVGRYDIELKQIVQSVVFLHVIYRILNNMLIVYILLLKLG